MSKELSILLVEDDPIAVQEMEQCIESTENVVLVSSANSVKVGLEYATDFLPNVIILDLEFHLGEGDGLTFLRKLKELELPVSPFILVTTNNTSSVIYDSVHQLGADFISSKHQPDYSAKTVIDFLIKLTDSILSKYSTKLPSTSAIESPVKNEQRIQRRINAELNNVGISPKSVGFAYLAEAILLVFNDSGKDFSTTIGKNHNKVNKTVERSMQNAIDVAWRNTNIDDLIKHYTAPIHSSKGCPTLTDFVYYYANKIKTDY